MAEVNINLKCDLQHAVKVQYLDGNLFSQDAAANIINIEVTDGGAPATIGGTVSANVIRPDGGTVAVTGGTISGNIVSITLPAACYAMVGMITIVVKLSSDSVVTTLAAAVAYVYQSSTDTVVDPGTVVSSIQDLIEAIDTAVASIPADYSNLWTSLAPAFSSSTAYKAGQYVTYDGKFWRFTTDHAAGAWNAAHATQVNVGGDMSDLKSANNQLIAGLTSGDPVALPLRWEHGIINAQGQEASEARTDYARTIDYFVPDADMVLNMHKVSSVSAIIYIKYNMSGVMQLRIADITNTDIQITLEKGYQYRFCVTLSNSTVFNLNTPDTYATFTCPVLVSSIGVSNLKPELSQFFATITDIFAGSSVTKDTGTTTTKTNNTISVECTSDSISYAVFGVPIEYGKTYIIYYDLAGTMTGANWKSYLKLYNPTAGSWYGDNLALIDQTSGADASGTIKVSPVASGIYNLGMGGFAGDGQEITGSIYVYDVTDLSNSDISSIDFSAIGSAKTIIIGVNTQADNNSWVGKKVVFYGDSITQGSYPAKVQSVLKFDCVVNAVGGSRFGYISSDPSINANALSSDTRIQTIPADADVVCIMGGTNDFQYTEIEETLTYSSGFDRTKFKGSVAYTIQHIQNQCPSAEIYLLTLIGGRGNPDPSVLQPLPMVAETGAGAGKSSLDIRNAMIEVAGIMNIPVIDTWSCGINGLNRDTTIKDAVHPTDKGNRLIAEYITGVLANNAPW